MGRDHFDAMYSDGLDVDRVALPMAVFIWENARRARESHDLIALEAARFWNIPFDKLVYLMRGLAEVDKRFIAGLQESLAAGKLRAKAYDQYGNLHKDVRDPEYLADSTMLGVRPVVAEGLIRLYPKPISGNEIE